MESLNELIKTYVHNLSIFYCKNIKTDKDLEDAINKLQEVIKNMLERSE